MPALAPAPVDSHRYLDFVTRNDTASETIFFIHGIGATGDDWDLVTPHLENYHLLIPSLFTASSWKLAQDTNFLPADTKDTSDRLHWQDRYVLLLRDLVRNHAKGSRAHIVGLSLGGCFALALTAAHPELVLSTFITGLPTPIKRPISGIWQLATGGFWALNHLTALAGPRVINYFLDNEVQTHPAGCDGKGGAASYRMNEVVIDVVAGGYPVPQINCDALVETDGTKSESSTRVKLRVRIVAATRRSMWTPTGDSPEWATEAAKRFAGIDPQQEDAELRRVAKERLEVQVFEAKRMFHPWSRQDPELFAKCILATVRGTEFPKEDMDFVWKL